MASLQTVLFVCLHGSAKSVIAAAHLRRLAARRGVAVESAAAGVEPDTEIPPHVRDGLLADGLEIGVARPQRVTAEVVRAATHVVSFGCELPKEAAEHRSVEYWTDVPAVSDGYDPARRVIVRRLASLLTRLAADPPRSSLTITRLPGGP